MNRARSAWSRHSVYISSNWSTTTQLSGSPSCGASSRPWVAAGVAPA